MRIVLSQHARLRMRERGIARSEVCEAIQSADRTEHSSRSTHRYLAKRVYHHRTLRRKHLLMVVYEMRRKSVRVVTVIDTSRITKYL